jgi:hypothetical protein
MQNVTMPWYYVQIALLMAYIDSSLASRVGPFTLEYLKLDTVVEPVPLDVSARQKRWFNFFA